MNVYECMLDIKYLVEALYKLERLNVKYGSNVSSGERIIQSID